MLLLVVGYDRMQMMYWVGRTDLEVAIAVTDAESGRALVEARIDAVSEGGLYDKPHPEQFQLVTGADGTARQLCSNSMCFGTESGLRFTNSFVVHLPWWYVRVSAPGYESSDLIQIDTPENARRVQRVGPNKTQLVVPIELRRSRPSSDQAGPATSAPK
jgi:hypothetical protein